MYVPFKYLQALITSLRYASSYHIAKVGMFAHQSLGLYSICHSPLSFLQLVYICLETRCLGLHTWQVNSHSCSRRNFSLICITQSHVTLGFVAVMHLQTDSSAVLLLTPKASGAWKNSSAFPVSLFPWHTRKHISG